VHLLVISVFVYCLVQIASNIMECLTLPGVGFGEIPMHWLCVVFFKRQRICKVQLNLLLEVRLCFCHK
jgi:hypothetical protein